MPVVRPPELTIGARSLALPVYFPSISSVKTALYPQEYLQLLSSLGGLNSQFLVSAFDLAHVDQPQLAQQALASARQAGIVTLMDSGNYESFWKDAQADWKQTDFHKMLADFPCDLAFSFDEQQPPANADKRTKPQRVAARSSPSFMPRPVNYPLCVQPSPPKPALQCWRFQNADWAPAFW